MRRNSLIGKFSSSEADSTGEGHTLTPGNVFPMVGRRMPAFGAPAFGIRLDLPVTSTRETLSDTTPLLVVDWTDQGRG